MKKHYTQFKKKINLTVSHLYNPEQGLKKKETEHYIFYKIIAKKDVIYSFMETYAGFVFVLKYKWEGCT